MSLLPKELSLITSFKLKTLLLSVLIAIRSVFLAIANWTVKFSLIVFNSFLSFTKISP
ncbi:hypothetical protein [Spiroplasma endosymbiont of Eupeodes luniger]|uniref:hypothetical protein n=1 Tax=Spiroplasma endosymbiont of Eupeodes luniger TaxID=3066300 RepID=UPI0030CC2E38